MSSKFSHCFVYGGDVYGTPYSSTGIDFMDSAECVCSSTDNVNTRTARILSEMCLYWGILTDTVYMDESKDGSYGLHLYAMRKFYSLAYRIEKLWGEYATRAVFNTCGFEF
jgi:hypothetical protein